MLVLLVRARPDFLLRALSYFRVPGRKRLHAVGLANVPANGRLILATNCHGTDQWMQVLSALDRGTKYVKCASPSAVAERIEVGARRAGSGPMSAYDSPTAVDHNEDSVLDALARRSGVMVEADGDAASMRQLVEICARTLQGGSLLGLPIDTPLEGERAEQLLEQLQARVPSCILPVHCGAAPTKGLHLASWKPVVAVGQPLKPDATPAEIRAAIEVLGDPARRDEAAAAAH